MMSVLCVVGFDAINVNLGDRNGTKSLYLFMKREANRFDLEVDNYG